MPTVPSLVSGYSTYASPIPHTPIPTLCVLNTHIPPFVSLRSPSRPHPSFPPCSLCGSQLPTTLLVALQHSPLVPQHPHASIHSLHSLAPTIIIGPLGVTPPSSVSLAPLPSIFLLGALADLYSSSYFQFVPAFWILSVRLHPHSGWSPVDLVTYTHGQVLVCSALCILYITPSPCHVLCYTHK